MSVPVFIDIAEQEQAAELRGYLKSKGAEISEENAESGLCTDLTQIIEATNVVWREVSSESEVESIFNSIISLILIIPVDKNENIVTHFCEKVSKVGEKSSKKYALRIRILSNLFYGLDARSHLRYNVYYSMVKLAGQSDMLQYIVTDVPKIQGWLSEWDVSAQQVQTLLRTLHDAFVDSKQSEKAREVMIKLLGTYTEDNASQAKGDAHKCIVTCLADPSCYLLDHLLSLKPVKFLEGELIHDLLTIFVSGTLHHYIDFCNSNKDFINSLGLSHEENMQKMRILTLMQMAETMKEIDFETLQKELQVAPEDVESFIIDVVRTRAVRAKIEQLSKKVIVHQTTHRTFGKQQWQQLREMVTHWEKQMSQVRQSILTVTPP